MMFSIVTRTRSLVRRSARAALATLSAVALVHSAQASTEYFLIELSALNEVPPNGSTATGVGYLVLDTVTGVANYNLQYSALSAAEVAAHIHGFAAPGANAGVLFGLPAGSPKVGSVTFSAAQVPNVVAGLTYVNIHSSANPGGEIRGQIVRKNAPFLLTATLSSAQEVPPNGSTATGNGTALMDVVAHTLSYSLGVSGLSTAQTAAHIHGFAPAGVNAGVLINIGVGTPISGTATLTPAQELNFLAGLTYFNVHTMMNPGGEIRGQLLRTDPDPVRDFCFGDGTGSACPCANDSVVGDNEGCSNSLGTGGRLRGAGAVSLARDAFVLSGTRMPSSSCLYFQGTNQAGAPAGSGTAFGDGKRCAGGAVIRLGTKLNANGSSRYPEAGDASVSVKGAVGSPGTRTYQAWYRNGAAFCTPSTFNLSNGVEVTWVP